VSGVRRLFHFSFFLFPFFLLATLNSAGYRYGASDQAFYIPAVAARLDPALFPRDGALIASQARLTRIDETLATLVRWTGLGIPPLAAALYLVALTLLATAGWVMARRLYRSDWAALAFVAALTLRHAIAKTGTNTLEAYFHPRQLAFGLGALGIALFLGGRRALPVALVLAGGLLHPTTALWFALWLGVALFVADGRWRIPLAVAAAGSAAAGIWAVAAGPLAGRLVRMDDAWLATLETKDYLFPLEWPLEVWLLNLAYVPVIVLVYRRRLAAGLATIREAAVVAGCLSLLLAFAAALPLVHARMALAVQMQTARVFWMLDFLAIAYAVWAIAEGSGDRPRRARLTCAAVVLLSLVRGTYVMLVRFPDRPVAQLGVRDDDWGRVMAWARTTEPGSGWIADPMHAVRYGTSVRVAAERDVLVEAVKDTAIGMYDRAVAMRTRERVAALEGFASMTEVRARALGDRYGLGYLVTEQALSLPIAYRSGTLRVYRLHDGPQPPVPPVPPR
jgi:hypothetical protein